MQLTNLCCWTALIRIEHRKKDDDISWKTIFIDSGRVACLIQDRIIEIVWRHNSNCYSGSGIEWLWLSVVRGNNRYNVRLEVEK